MIRIFPSNARVFDTNGLGVLSSATVCTVTEERNGPFELEMEYPITGLHYDSIQLRNLIVVEPNPYDPPQAFRIYSISKPINGIVTVNAQHISYDLSGIPVQPFASDSISTTFSNLKGRAITACPFDFWTDKSSSGDFHFETPTSIRSLLAGSEGSVLDVFGGGDYKFDNFNVRLYQNRGQNRGVTIRYGKNMTNIQDEESSEGLYSHICPYWYNEDVGLVEIPGKVIETGLTLDTPCVKVVNLTEYLQKPEDSQVENWAPTQAALETVARAYVSLNRDELTIPNSNIQISFLQLQDMAGSDSISLLETVHLCDVVSVQYPKLGVNCTTRCISTTYNAITKKYDSIELGRTANNLVTQIGDANRGLNELIDGNLSDLQKAIIRATNLITGGQGGYVILHSSDPNSKYPDEILIMDQPSIEKAKKVWRWNKAGLGYSSTGYNGSYGLAMTMDGAIVADYITTGYLSGARIKAGTISTDQLTNNLKTTIDGKFDRDQVIAQINLSNKGIVSTVGALQTDVQNKNQKWVESIIEQKPDMIRMQSRKILWDSTNSKMLENGTLIATQMRARYGIEVYPENANPKIEAYIDFHENAYSGESETDQHDYAVRLCMENDDTLMVKTHRYVNAGPGLAALISDTVNSQFKCGTISCINLNQSSDARLKCDIRDLSFEDSLKTIKSLIPKTYHFIDNPSGKLHHGFVYQDVENSVDPDWAFLNKDTINDTKIVYGSLAYTQLIADLVCVAKGQNEQIKRLEERLDSLERRCGS